MSSKKKAYRNLCSYSKGIVQQSIFSSVLLQTLPIDVVFTPGCPLPPLSLPPFAIEAVVAEEVVVVESMLPPGQTKLLQNSLTLLVAYSGLT